MTLKTLCNQKSGLRLRLKLQVSGCLCHMDGMRLKKDGVCGLTVKSLRIRGREVTQKSEGCCCKEQQTHSAPRLSVHPFFPLLGFAKGVKKNTQVWSETPRGQYACDAAIPPTPRLDAEANCLQEQNQSAATIHLRRRRVDCFTNVIFSARTLVLLKLSITP